MPTYKIATFQDEDILKVVITGELANDDVRELTNEVYDIVRSSNAKKLLCDIRDLKGRLGFTDMQFFLTNVPSLFYNIYTAFVDIPENANLQPFRQYVARHAGLPAKWYTDTDDAILWLKQKPKQIVR